MIHAVFNRSAFCSILSLCLLTAFTLPAFATPPSPERQPQEDVPQMLSVVWSAGVPMPQGLQDNHVNLIDGWLVSVLGFCSGADDDWKPGIYPRGFLNKAWGLNLKKKATAWVELPPFPGAPRQAGQGACLDNALYLWGGFSYTEPYTYTDGFKLSRKDGTWTWEALPPLPSPSCWAGTTVVGSKIYFIGGADYDAQRFYALEDRTGKIKGKGAQTLVFDTKNPEAGWVAKTPLPGTPRCLNTTTTIDGTIYVMGGVSMMPDGAYGNVVDSWRYDPEQDSWKRLRDLPMSGSGGCSGTVAYKNRYILLPCGYQYGIIVHPDGTSSPMYGTPEKITRSWENHPRYKTTHYYNHFYVYDTKTDLFGKATLLPTDDVASITYVLGDTAYIFPGETGGFYWDGEYFGHHPEFVLKGALTELDWE